MRTGVHNGGKNWERGFALAPEQAPGRGKKKKESRTKRKGAAKNKPKVVRGGFRNFSSKTDFKQES